MVGLGSIYGIYFPGRRKVYIGSSGETVPVKRWWCHMRALREGKHHCRKLQAIFDQEGETAMVFKILEHVRMTSTRALREREQAWVDRYAPTGHALNEVRALADLPPRA